MTGFWRSGAVTATIIGGVLWTAAALADSPTPWQTGLPDGATPVKAMLNDFHSLLLWVIIAVVVLVTGLLAFVVLRFNAAANPVPSRNSHNTLLEIAWTLVPVAVLAVIAVPSFRVLYYLETTPDADMTLKITGRQWYWDYEYPDHDGVSFSAIMIADDDLKPGQLRLLETEPRVVLPVGANVRLLLTAGDVIHSWAVPAFGVKKDAVPGRVNETWLRIDREGVYYGQCSEICGVNHGFMPITVEAVSPEKFAAWIAQAKQAHGPPSPRDVVMLAQ